MELGRLVDRPTLDLQPHPKYQELAAPTLAGRIRRIAEKPGPIIDPLVTTTKGVILDGHARWRVALERQQSSLPCFENEVTDEAALVSIIRHHRGATGLNDFCRILISLELESSFKRHGGHFEPMDASSNLTKPSRQDVRVDLARVAGVSTGNVTKVKQVLEATVPEIREALITGQVRIHRAWLWRTLAPKAQRDALWQHLNRRVLEQKIARLVNAHAKRVADVPELDSNVSAAVAHLLGLSDASNLTIAVVDIPGRALAVTREYLDELRRNQVE